MPAWMEGWPVVAVLLFFLSGALLRSQAIYWVGRGVTAGVLRGARPGTGEDVDDPDGATPAQPTGGVRAAAHRWRVRAARRLDSAQVDRARSAIERWGMPVVPLAFLTVGFQSAVFGAAGLLRVGWLRFTLWALPGAVVWALVWGGGGMAAAAGVLAAARRSPATLALVLVVAGVAISAVLAVARSRRPAGSAPSRPGAESPAGRSGGSR